MKEVGDSNLIFCLIVRPMKHDPYQKRKKTEILMGERERMGQNFLGHVWYFLYFILFMMVLQNICGILCDMISYMADPPHLMLVN